MADNGSKVADRLEHEAELLEKEAETLEKTAHKLEEQAHELEHEAHKLEEQARREREKDHDHHHDDHGHNVKITMVVNGQPVVIEAKSEELLSKVRHKALEETQNLGQPAENWEIKNEAGQVLDPESKVGDHCFGREVTLFLSLKAGVAGA